MRYDAINKIAYLTYRDFLENSEFFGKIFIPERGLKGIEYHKNYQESLKQKNPKYKTEVSLTYKLFKKEIQFIFRGRIDALKEKEYFIQIEEFKTIFISPNELQYFIEYKSEAFRLQLLLYTYFFHLQTPDKKIVPKLILYNLYDDSIVEVDVNLDANKIVQIIDENISKIYLKIKKDQKWIAYKKNIASQIEFPYKQKRIGQEKMILSVENILENNNDLLLSAATGLGKTISILLPTIKYIYKNNKKLFWIIPKKTQRKIFFDTLKELKEKNNLTLKAIYISSKEENCINNHYICDADFCPFIKNYTTRLKETNSIEKLTERELIDKNDILDVAIENKLCPFELALDTSEECDILIGDYNYVMNPFIRIQRYFSFNYSHFVFCIDEGHNLPNRLRNNFNIRFTQKQIQSLIKLTSNNTMQVYKDLNEFFQNLENWLNDIFKDFEIENYNLTEGFYSVDIKNLNDFKLTFSKLLTEYLIINKKRKQKSPKDSILDFYFEFNKFISYSQLIGLESKFYVNVNSKYLQILALNFADFTKSIIDGFSSTIIFSATMLPYNFYIDVLGLSKDIEKKTFFSPFPSENLATCIIKDVSTRYSKREKYYESIALHINDIVQLNQKNYLVFFPSFKFLENVSKHIKVNNFAIISQRASMKENERQLILKLFKISKKPSLLFAVLGGIFAEGLDNFGKKLGGIIIISPAMPIFNFEQEALRNYFDRKFDMGFEYAYLYPAINKVIQAGGRLIRNENDRGILVLMGERFSERKYYQFFPENWYDKKIENIIPDNYKSYIEEFWGNNV